MEALITLSLMLGIYEYMSMLKSAEYDYEKAGFKLFKYISPQELLRDYRYDHMVSDAFIKIIIRSTCTILGFLGLVLCSWIHDIYYVYVNNSSFIKNLKDYDDEDDPAYDHFYKSHHVVLHNVGGHYSVDTKDFRQADSGQEGLEQNDKSPAKDASSISWHQKIDDAFNNDVVCLFMEDDIDHTPIVKAINKLGITNIFIGKYTNSNIKSIAREYDMNTYLTVYHVFHNDIHDALFSFWCGVKRICSDIDKMDVSTVILSNSKDICEKSQFSHIMVYNDPLYSEDELIAQVLAKLIVVTSTVDKLDED